MKLTLTKNVDKCRNSLKSQDFHLRKIDDNTAYVIYRNRQQVVRKSSEQQLLRYQFGQAKKRATKRLNNADWKSYFERLKFENPSYKTLRGVAVAFELGKIV